MVTEVDKDDRYRSFNAPVWIQVDNQLDVDDNSPPKFHRSSTPIRIVHAGIMKFKFSYESLYHEGQAISKTSSLLKGGHSVIQPAEGRTRDTESAGNSISSVRLTNSFLDL